MGTPGFKEGMNFNTKTNGSDDGNRTKPNEIVDLLSNIEEMYNFLGPRSNNESSSKKPAE